MKTSNILINLKKVISTSSGTCLFLGNEEKTFVIYVDSIMGEQIRFAITQKTPKRPLTPNFIRYILRGFDITLQNIVLHHENEGTFYAKIILKQLCQQITKIVELDARPSDAILLSLALNKPIYIDDNLFTSLNDISDLLKTFNEANDY